MELKNGETYNGHLVACDSWMNVHLREVICTSKDGDRFWRMPETYIRGNTIKYLRVPDEVIDKVKDEAFRRDGAPACFRIRSFVSTATVRSTCNYLEALSRWSGRGI